MMWKSLEHRQYRKRMLDRSRLANDPWQQLASWYGEAEIEETEPSAMCLSTCTPDGLPSARMVLMKSFGPEGLIFYTHYESRKGRELSANPRAACVFFWPETERQITLEGPVEPLEPQDSDDYFDSRPLESQVAASISRQGQPVGSRELLLEYFYRGMERSEHLSIKRPPWWGGYRIRPQRFEFWQGREYRLHDRFEYLSRGGQWQIQRLCP